MSDGPRVEAADGLRFECGPDGSWRVAWHTPDWLGPVGLRLAPGGRAWSGEKASVRPVEAEDDLGPYRGLELAFEGAPLPVRASVRGYRERPVLVFRLEAQAEIDALATGSFARPSAAWPWFQPAERAAGGVPEGTRGFAHQFTEFAFPTLSGPGLDDFFLFPHRPAVVAPLWLNAPGRSLLLAPQGAFHDQVISLPQAEPERAGVACGWQGDLAGVPAGFASEIAVWAGSGPRSVLEEWAALLRARHGTRRPSRYADASLGRLSYWTDNGAAYWYRTEPGCDVTTTLGRVADALREQEVPVAAFELDSWFYPHERSRPVNPEGQEHVPPSGLLSWEAREDVLPGGIPALRRRLGDPPLVLHARHFSSQSPYFERYPAWLDADRGHPIGPELFFALLGQAADWGSVCVEQDWLVEMFLGVRGLRERPGRARAWQEGYDRAAEAHGLSLLWCMATPADFLQSVSLRRVAAIRTSGDYRYLARNATLWSRFLYNNALARALGLLPFKDVFASDPTGTGKDGDPLAEVEALLAALSAGPVGIGDRLGRTDRGIVMRTCRADGVLVKPDVPIAALERCFLADAWFEAEPLVAETHSRHPAGRWSYLASFHAARERKPLRFEVALSDLGELRPTEAVIALDWRTGRFERLEPDATLPLELAPDAWDYRVLCPLLPGNLAVFGDTSLYATVGDRRIRDVRTHETGALLDVLGAPGEQVAIDGFCARDALAVETWTPAGREAVARVESPEALDAAGHGWWRDRGSGRFRVGVEIGERGWVGLRLAAA